MVEAGGPLFPGIQVAVTSPPPSCPLSDDKKRSTGRPTPISYSEFVLYISYIQNIKMKFAVALFAVVCMAALASARPQKEGSQFTNEAIRQAQNTFLIPKDAEIQNVQEAIELSAFENLPGNQRIDLAQILGAHVPAEVVTNLQAQVDRVGGN